jgi:hypothetical protein
MNGPDIHGNYGIYFNVVVMSDVDFVITTDKKEFYYISGVRHFSVQVYASQL